MSLADYESEIATLVALALRLRKALDRERNPLIELAPRYDAPYHPTLERLQEACGQCWLTSSEICAKLGVKPTPSIVNTLGIHLQRLRLVKAKLKERHQVLRVWYTAPWPDDVPLPALSQIRESRATLE